MKRCYKCNKIKNYDQFYKSKDTKDGSAKECKECNRVRGRAYRAAHQDKIKKAHAAYLINNAAKIKQYHQNRYLLKKQIYYENNKKWSEENKERVKELWRKNARRPETKHRHRINEARRRATKLKATPRWLSTEQMAQIKAIYDNCPMGYHVDHIIPLRGKTISGLHVPWNLQYLTPSENYKKNNRLILIRG